MDLNLKLGEVLVLRNALHSAAKITMPAALAYRFSTIRKKLEVEATAFEEQRMGVFKRYGHEVEDKPGVWQIEDEHMEAANAELKPLSEEGVTISNVVKVKVSELEESGVQIDAETMYGLDAILEA